MALLWDRAQFSVWIIRPIAKLEQNKPRFSSQLKIPEEHQRAKKCADQSKPETLLSPGTSVEVASRKWSRAASHITAMYGRQFTLAWLRALFALRPSLIYRMAWTNRLRVQQDPESCGRTLREMHHVLKGIKLTIRRKDRS